MKKLSFAVSLLLVCAMLAACLLSCGSSDTLTGSYTKGREVAGLGGWITYTFKKDGTVNITVSIVRLTTRENASYDGTYEIIKDEDGKKKIEFTFGDEDAFSYTGTHSFLKGEDDDGKYIYIDNDKFSYVKNK